MDESEKELIQLSNQLMGRESQLVNIENEGHLKKKVIALDRAITFFYTPFGCF